MAIILDVSYGNGIPNFGPRPMEAKIEKAVGKQSTGGSGTMITFSFRSRKDARNAARRVRRMAKQLKRRVTCYVWPYR